MDATTWPPDQDHDGQAGYSGTVESNVYQRTVDYPEDFYNGIHVMLDSKKLVTVRWGQVEPASRPWPSFPVSAQRNAKTVQCVHVGQRPSGPVRQPRPLFQPNHIASKLP